MLADQQPLVGLKSCVILNGYRNLAFRQRIRSSRSRYSIGKEVLLGLDWLVESPPRFLIAVRQFIDTKVPTIADRLYCAIIPI